MAVTQTHLTHCHQVTCSRTSPLHEPALALPLHWGFYFHHHHHRWRCVACDAELSAAAPQMLMMERCAGQERDLRYDLRLSCCLLLRRCAGASCGQSLRRCQRAGQSPDTGWPSCCAEGCPPAAPPAENPGLPLEVPKGAGSCFHAQAAVYGCQCRCLEAHQQQHTAAQYLLPRPLDDQPLQLNIRWALGGLERHLSASCQ